MQPWRDEWFATPLRSATALLWRGVEAQHRVATMRLVDTLDEQADKFIVMGKELFLPTIEQMRNAPDDQPSVQLLQNGVKIVQDAKVFLSIAKMVKKVDFIFGTAPALLEGYGAYGWAFEPSFDTFRLSLVDRGFVYAIAHVRGGGELGRRWYEDGKLLHKVHTFTDFIAVARHLVDTGVTTGDRQVALGGSAGGLLMGAVANMAPELFAGILAQVPFVDPLTSMLDPSLPLTVTEWDEWGNPLADKDVYDYMASYSPYENVGPRDYPAILAMTSLNDTRVLYVEPAKWVAALRHAKTDAHPVLLKTQMSAGHGGVSGRYERWREVAFQYAWLLCTSGCADSSAAVLVADTDSSPGGATLRE